MPQLQFANASLNLGRAVVKAASTGKSSRPQRQEEQTTLPG